MKPKIHLMFSFVLCSFMAFAAVDVDAEILRDLDFFQELELIQTDSSDSEANTDEDDDLSDEAELLNGVKE
jgi:hypothetical protein